MNFKKIILIGIIVLILVLIIIALILPHPKDDITYTPLDTFTFSSDLDNTQIKYTETMWLKDMNGSLFAGTSQWYKGINANNWKYEAGVVRKDCATCSWVVDTIFPGTVRADSGLVIHKSDIPGLTQELLLVGPAYVSNPTLKYLLRLENGTWLSGNIKTYTEDEIVRRDSPSFRSSRVHTDKVTGKALIFVGTSDGEVISGTLDVNTYSITWNAPETNIGSRVMAMTEANGDLYVSIGAVEDKIEDGSVGGIYKRIDGPSPTYELVFNLKGTLSGKPANLRGITTVNKNGKTIILGAGENTDLIYATDVSSKETTVELDLKEFLSKKFGTSYKDTLLAAYNYFEPFTNPVTGKVNHIIGLWMKYPGNDPVLEKSAWFLVRDELGNYELYSLYDPNHSSLLPLGTRGIRTAIASPFFGEENVIYFGGPDAGGQGTFEQKYGYAWIYKGKIQKN